MLADRQGARGLDVTVGDLFSTITPGPPLRIPRRTITLARESLRSLSAMVDAIDRKPAPSEDTIRYELRRPLGSPRRLRRR